MLKQILAFGSILVCLQSADAQIRQFPYQATIEEDEVYVRCGPGRRYYPTAKLQRGSRVTVHRHDPGGWYMIAPPANSFSWVRAEYVEKSLGNRGTLNQNNVVVRVGSQFGNDRDVEQVRLSIGDEVEILDEKTFDTTQGKIRMYKISSPRGEFRWISARAVSPANAIVKQQNDLDPYTIPSNAKRKTKTSDEKLGSYEQRTKANSKSQSSKNKTTTNEVQQQEQKLAELDNQFRETIKQEHGAWDLLSLEKGYDQLNRQVQDPALKIQLAQRFPALEKYKRIKQDYANLAKITNNSLKQEQQPPSRQQAFYPSAPNPRAAQPVNRQLQPPTQDSRFRPNQKPTPDPRYRQPLPQQNQRYPNRGTRPTISQNRQQPIPQRTPQRTPRFAGAGIVQRAASRVQGAPQYVLLAPGGRILAYLQAGPGINLEAHIGRSWGIHGKREFRQNLGTDFLYVQQLTPVRLKGM